MTQLTYHNAGRQIVNILKANSLLGTGYRVRKTRTPKGVYAASVRIVNTNACVDECRRTLMPALEKMGVTNRAVVTGRSAGNAALLHPNNGPRYIEVQFDVPGEPANPIAEPEQDGDDQEVLGAGWSALKGPRRNKLQRQILDLLDDRRYFIAISSMDVIGYNGAAAYLRAREHGDYPWHLYSTSGYAADLQFDPALARHLYNVGLLLLVKIKTVRGSVYWGLVSVNHREYGFANPRKNYGLREHLRVSKLTPGTIITCRFTDTEDLRAIVTEHGMTHGWKPERGSLGARVLMKDKNGKWVRAQVPFTQIVSIDGHVGDQPDLKTAYTF